MSTPACLPGSNFPRIRSLALRPAAVRLGTIRGEEPRVLSLLPEPSQSSEPSPELASPAPVPGNRQDPPRTKPRRLKTIGAAEHSSCFHAPTRCGALRHETPFKSHVDSVYSVYLRPLATKNAESRSPRFRVLILCCNATVYGACWALRHGRPKCQRSRSRSVASRTGSIARSFGRASARLSSIRRQSDSTFTD